MFEYPEGISGEAHISFRSKSWQPIDPKTNTAEVKSAGGGFGCNLYVPGGVTKSIGAKWNVESTLQAEAGSVMGRALHATGTHLASKLGNFGSAGVSSAKAAGGVALHPNEMLLFQGTDHYNFSITFDLVPRTAGEASAIMGIVSGFNNALLPTQEQKGNSLFINFPAIFDITAISGGGSSIGTRTKHLFSYQNMALLQMEVSYSNGTPSLLYFEDGTPVITTLNLTFQSIVPAKAREI